MPAAAASRQTASASAPAAASNAPAHQTDPYAVVALEEERVVGFARAMSDEAFAVYIADVLVAPDRQRQGIGRTLAEEKVKVETLVQSLRQTHVLRR